jgi:large subunit ribosomal protein L6
MSKIGRQPISLGDVKVEIKGAELHYTGKNNSGIYLLPDALTPVIEEGALRLEVAKKSRDINRIWGLHRAILSNKISGASQAFEKQVKITGLGYKAIPKGQQIEFSLGYSHKINFDLPKDVTVEVDRTGQLLTLKSYDKELVGQVSGQLRKLRPTEPYKGTGVRLTTDRVIRKAGKAKGA